MQIWYVIILGQIFLDYIAAICHVKRQDNLAKDKPPCFPASPQMLEGMGAARLRF